MCFHYLQLIIEWHPEVQYDWKVNPNKFGRWFKRFLDTATRKELEGTYSGTNLDENWQALFNTMALFRRLALEVGEHLDCSYDHEVDEKLSSY
ncbi:aminoglycoside 6-adenylyltransferase [Jeotgalibacillus soli]|uniref:Uncharacterized protein n=1 Tax=Jeotgalibacillus soli TaxID=889306 RepID=A0A0C2VYI5_9BACL|nr:aminoglycoside 6-adenylyltransferase [Jeotgalibacillus soli]KIL49466.1 hypothetical protein KP78_09340 [Jeotgalibacillus soli]